MFAALCENPDFFRDRMKLYVAIAPVLYLKDLKNAAPKLYKAVNDKAAYSAFKSTGPEHFTTSAGSNAAKDWLGSTMMGKYL